MILPDSLRDPKVIRRRISLAVGAHRQLSALVLRRRQLVEMRVMESNRLGTAHSEAKKSIRSMIHLMGTQLRHVEEALAAHIKEHHKETAELLLGVKGVGVTSATALIG